LRCKGSTFFLSTQFSIKFFRILVHFLLLLPKITIAEDANLTQHTQKADGQHRIARIEKRE
jgi:hypothetical protein